MQSRPLVPALQNSLLLTVHVFTAVIAYGAFTLGFIVSVLLLIQKERPLRIAAYGGQIGNDRLPVRFDRISQ